MRKISVIAMGANLLLVNVAWAADLPSTKDAGCNCRLHVTRAAVALNNGGGWVPLGAQASLESIPEGKLLASNDVGLDTRRYGPGWHAHFEPSLPPLQEGSLVNVKPGGVAHLGWPDGTSMDLPEGVTRVGPELCKAKTAPVAAFPVAPALLGLAAAGAIAGGVIAGTQPNTDPPPVVPPFSKQ